MKIAVKIIFALVILVVLGVLGFLFYIRSLVDVNSIRSSINGNMSKTLQEYNNHYHFKNKNIAFNIKGQISVSFPSKLIINDIYIENIQYKDVLLNGNIKKVEVELNRKDLMKKVINPKNINILGANFYIDKNKLDDFYYNVEKVKKIVKLEDNEVFGVKDKLKSLLTSDDSKNSEIEEGYKEIEVEERVRYDLDNSKVRFMLVDVFNTLKQSIKINNIVSFNNVFVTIINNKNIEKEFKNIICNIKFNNGNTNIKTSFVLNNINGFVNLEIKKEKEDKYSYNLTLSNNINDVINIKALNDNVFTNNFNDIDSSMELNLQTQNLNNIIQWLFSINSSIYNMFNYKKSLTLESKIEKTKEYYNIKDIKVNAEDIKLSSNINLSKTNNKIDINIEKIDLNNFIINFKKQKYSNDDANIKIFKYDTIDKFLSSIKKTDLGSMSDFNLIIQELKYKTNILNNSSINITKENNVYKINKLDINFKDFNITASEPIQINDFYYNDLTITGDNFSFVSNLINAENIVKLSKFSANAKLIINDNTFYLYEYVLRNEKNEDITKGNMEYSLNNNNHHIAITSIFDNLSINVEKKQTSTLKEKFLGLNSISNNIFVDLKVNNLKYNDKSMVFDSKIHYYPGFIHFYNIKNISTDNIKNVTGQLLLGLGNKEPIINSSLVINEINYEDDLINYIFDVEKYKNILLETEIDKEKQQKYWVTKLFAIPTFEEIGGNINFKVNNILVNNSKINNLYFMSSINNGLINIVNFKFDGFGGSTEIKGSLDLKKSKNFNLILTDTIYDIEEIFRLFSKKENDSIKGKVGVGGVFKANGFNESVFLSSMNFNFKFISNNLFIKKLGLEEIRDKLNLIYTDETVLSSFDTEKLILNDSGTTFKDVNGRIALNQGVNNFVVDAKTDSISNKLVLKIDNSGKALIIDAINTSIVMTKVGETNIPLYSIITFKEDFANKAKLTINTAQIDEYVKKVKDTKLNKN